MQPVGETFPYFPNVSESFAQLIVRENRYAKVVGATYEYNRANSDDKVTKHRTRTFSLSDADCVGVVGRWGAGGWRDRRSNAKLTEVYTNRNVDFFSNLETNLTNLRGRLF